MIFVTLGTQKQDFSRLLNKVENSECLKNEKVIVQAGHTKFNSKFMEVHDFFNIDEMKNYILQADMVITHGGVGSIIDALNMGKKVLAMPRLEEYKEHINNHQLEICKKLSDEGYIECIYDGDNIDEKIKIIRNKEYNRYMPEKKYLEIIKKDIEEFVK